jgi:hypothetical protein
MTALSRACFTLLGLVLLFDPAQSAPAEGVPSFQYTERIQNEIVLPILRRELGEGIPFYDPANPQS